MTRHTTRGDAIARVHARLTASGYPRAVVLFILALSGGIAFLVSAGTLRLGLEQMGVRYFLATLAGYGTFLLLIRAWIAYRRGFDDEVDVVSGIPNSGLEAGAHVQVNEEPGVATFAGGRSGGGGASASWGKPTGSGGVADALPVDADELWPLVLAAACTVGAVFAIFYVVYAAPLLLAEVALDAALVGSLYRGLRRQDTRHWLDSAFRRTWLPALAVSMLLMVTGFALQWAEPDARSIGGVVRELLQR